jgi:CRP-like cAMP-binding protein
MNQSMHSVISAKTFPPSQVAKVLRQDFSIKTDRLKLPTNGLIQNDILAALPAEELAFLLPHLELVQLPFGKELHTDGSTLSHAYFPTTAIITLSYIMADGTTTEIGVIGHEGILGMSILMGDNSLGEAKVETAGCAYKLKASILKEACARAGKLQHFLMRYTQALFAQMAQNSVCGRHYSIDQQLSRWLLDRLDRLRTNEFQVTQEAIANMLGVRRESITMAVGKLQIDGLILWRRGNITVLDRDRLEMLAGECYKVAKREFDMVLTEYPVKKVISA